MKNVTNGFIKPQKLRPISTLLATLLTIGCSNASPPPKEPMEADKLKPAKEQPIEMKSNDGRKKISIGEAQKLNKQKQIIVARKDLAKRLDLDLEEVQLSGMTPVTWRSGALGCPQANKQYTQALVPGVLIMLRVGNTPYRYHAIPGGEPFYCPDSMAEPPYMNSSDA